MLYFNTAKSKSTIGLAAIWLEMSRLRMDIDVEVSFLSFRRLSYSEREYWMVLFAKSDVDKMLAFNLDVAFEEKCFLSPFMFVARILEIPHFTCQ